MAKQRRTTTVDEAILSAEEQDALKKEISFKLRVGKNFWRPLHMRMDYWYSMYLLLDPIQQMKPLGVRRFISNEPHTAVDSAISILTRNDSFWRIEQMEDPTMQREERRTVGKIERTLQGLMLATDENFTRRGEPKLWKRVAQEALLRGWIWGKFHITNAALPYRPEPLIAEIYDARTVYPHFDQWGLEYVVIESNSSLGELATTYPDIWPEYLDMSKFDPASPAVKIEYWSNDRMGRPGITGVMAIIQASQDRQTTLTTLGSFYDNPLSDAIGTARWIIEPYRHGYTPEQLPVVGVPVNGLGMKSKPFIHPLLASRLEERADLLAIQTQTWSGPGTWQADSGRSILASVEDQVPQYNEIVATIFHHFSLSAFGTHVFTTPTGEIPDVEFGIEAKIALRPEEKYQRVEMAPINSDAFRLMQILQQEKERGTLSSVLQAATSLQGINTGVLFQQVANAALNSLEPYHDGMETFGQLVGTSILAQLQVAAPALQPFILNGRTRSHSYFSMEFDPKNDLDLHRKYKPIPVFKPALPDDLAIRIQAARLALDPRNPILSLRYVLENLIQVDDVQGEIDSRWEDLVNSDPIIALEQLADAAERAGEPQIAERLRQNEFRSKFAEEIQFRQLTGGAGPTGMGDQNASLVMPPEAGGGSPSTARTGAGNEGALAAQGAALMGAMGERGAA